MKFLHLINVRWYNATAWYAVNISRLLKEKGHEVIVAGLPGTPPVLKAREYGLKTFEANFNSSNPFKVINTIKSVNKLLNEFKPHVVNCHRGEFFWYFAFLKCFGKKDFKLIRVRGDIRPPSYDLFNKKLHSNCTDKIIVSGDIIKNYFTEGMKLNPEKIDTIFGGVNTNVFKQDIEARHKVRKEFGFTDDDFVVGIVGRFDFVKGHKVLIEAVSKLYYDNEMNNIKLFLIGFDTTIKSDEIVQLLEEFKIKDISFISGYREDINACINALDLGVIASLGSEAICRVAMEIMAAKIPVVSSDVGVLPEILPKENIYPRGNPVKLAEKILNHSKEIKIYSDENFVEKYLESVIRLLNL